MDVMTAVLTRRSEQRLRDPAPCDEEFAYLVKAAATAPDHGMLRPWRWILVRGEGRQALGNCFADDSGADSGADSGEGQRDRAAAKALRAPLLATLVFTPRRGHRIPEWEQLAATTAMAHSLMLLLHSRGFGSIWRTGASSRSVRVRRLLRLGEEEQLLGWLYIGTPQRTASPRRRVADDITGRLSTFVPEALEPLKPLVAAG